MAQYKTPGVYVEEKSTLPPSVAEVATAIPVFIGYTERSESSFKDSTNHDIKINRISSMLAYQTLFGGHYSETITVASDADNNVTITKTPSMPSFMLRQAVEMFFANGGGACYIASCGTFPEASGPDKKALSAALATCKEVDEITLLCVIDGYQLDGTAYYDLQNEALMQCASTQDRFTIMSTQETSIKTLSSAKIAEDSGQLRNGVSSTEVKYGAAYYPNLNTSYAHAYDEEKVDVSITSIISGGNTDTEGNTDTGVSEETTTLKLVALKSDNTEVYHAVKAALAKNHLTLPPTSAIAGVYSQVDNSRGVWKAPANVALNRVVSLSKTITDDDQDRLNKDALSGKSINAIRFFTGKGQLVWGARTLAGNDLEWSYVSVRRFFNMVEESIAKATSFAVFEPNTPTTWMKLKTMISSYLRSLWMQGALFGGTEEQAFFVHVGLGDTMTEDDINNGIVNIEIGIAAVRPAEFIVLTFSHKSIEA